MPNRLCPICDCHFSGHDPSYKQDCIRFLADRVKEIESKLGAVDVGLSTGREAVAKLPISASSPPAAPSVSAEYWHHLAERWEHVIARWETGRNIPASYTLESALRNLRAYRLAAAVTEWYDCDPRKMYGLSHAEDLIRIVIAFVRGEPLPQKGG